MTARPLAFAAVVAACSFSVTAAAAERVIFCATATGACAGAGRTLGTSAAGAWVEIEDADLMANTQQIPPLLYFSRAAYDNALAGLSKKEKEQAILKRAREKAGPPQPGLVELVYDDCVDLAIAAGGDADAVAAALEAATFLAGGAEANQDVPLPRVLDRVIQSLAKLRAELPNSGAVVDGYRAEAEALDDLATGRRGGKGTRSFPAADPERVYFIPGRKVPKRFDGELPELQGYGWNGGEISTMRPEDAAATKGPRPKLLYYSNRLFLADQGSLTEAQFDRRLRARLRGVPAGERAALAARLAFEHAVTARQYGATLQRRAPDSLASWNEAVRGDGDNLHLALAAARATGAGAKAARAPARRRRLGGVRASRRVRARSEPGHDRTRLGRGREAASQRLTFGAEDGGGARLLHALRPKDDLLRDAPRRTSRRFPGSSKDFTRSETASAVIARKTDTTAPRKPGTAGSTPPSRRRRGVHFDLAKGAG